MKQLVLGLLLLLTLMVGTTQAQQNPPAVVAGVSVMNFDHDGLDTSSYELCIDALTACTIIVTTRVGTTDVVSFVLPASVPRGDRILRVRAIGPAGTSDPSDVVTFRAYVKPAKPGVIRIP